MPRRAQSDEPQTDSESEQEEQPAGGGGPKNPSRTLQHMMLHVFFSRPVMTNVAVKRVYAKCVQLSKIASAPSLATFMSDLEAPLATCGLSLKNRLDVDTNTLTWILLNDYSDEPSKLATEYSPQEIAFFRIIVKKIMTASRMAYAIKLKEAIQYSKSAGLPTIMHGQAVITSFIAKGWLCRSAESRLTLSHRARTELWKYLKETFEDEDEDIEPHDRSYVSCKVCIELVTKGWACPSETCVVRLHDKCVAPFLNAHNGVCPGTDVVDCGQQWPGNTVKGFTGVTVGLGDSEELFSLAEDADTDDEAAAAAGSGDDEDDAPATQKKKGARKSNASAASGKGKGKGKAAAKGKHAAGSDDDEEMEEPDDDEEEDEAEESADDAVQGLAAAVSQKQSNPRQKKAVKYQSDDEDMSE